MGNNLLIVHGGGPTAVINATLYGVIEEAARHPEIGEVLGAAGGTSGILEERFLSLSGLPEMEKKLLLSTPGSAIGSSRFPVYEKDYENMREILLRHGINYVLFNGGNGTMDTCGKLQKACVGSGITVVGIPKTVDNDINAIDHAPGFGSAARYIAEVTREVGEDVRSLPIHVAVIEAMGRNAGWVTAASAAARKKAGDAPHIILVPEIPFEEEAFLNKVEEIRKEKGGVVVVASEGLKDAAGNPVVPPIFKTERATYYGDVGTYLAELVIRKLGVKARSEKPGLLGRSSIALSSEVDREEAVLVGRQAVLAAVQGQGGVMVGITRRNEEPYGIDTPLIPIEEVMLTERVFPPEYISEDGMDVKEDYITWLKPLLGRELPDYAYLQAFEKENENHG